MCKAGLVVGFTGGTLPQILANIVMVKNVDILGLNYGNYRALNPDVLTESFRIMMEWYREGKTTLCLGEVFFGRDDGGDYSCNGT